MVKTVSATEAKNRLGSLLGDLASSDDAVIIENRGVATAALISMESYEAFKALAEADRRRQAYEDFLKLRAEIAERTKDIPDDEIETMIGEMSSEINARINARWQEQRERKRDVS